MQSLPYVVQEGVCRLTNFLILTMFCFSHTMHFTPTDSEIATSNNVHTTACLPWHWCIHNKRLSAQSVPVLSVHAPVSVFFFVFVFPCQQIRICFCHYYLVVIVFMWVYILLLSLYIIIATLWFSIGNRCGLISWYDHLYISISSKLVRT